MRKLVRRSALVAAFVMALAVIMPPEWCEALPDWLADALGCPCSSGDCSGAK